MKLLKGVSRRGRAELAELEDALEYAQPAEIWPEGLDENKRVELFEMDSVNLRDAAGCCK